MSKICEIEKIAISKKFAKSGQPSLGNAEDDGERGNNGNPHLVIANCIVGDEVDLPDVFGLIRA